MLFQGENPNLPTDRGPVLILDQNSAYQVSDITAKKFAEWGYSVVVAQDIHIALAVCDQITPVLVVMGEMCSHISPTTFLCDLAIRLGSKTPPLSLLVFSWSRCQDNGDNQMTISMSPLVSVEEVLSFTAELCAA